MNREPNELERRVAMALMMGASLFLYVAGLLTGLILG